LAGSIDINDPRCKARRAFSNGTRSDAELKIEAYLLTAAKYQNDSIQEGPKNYQGHLGHNGVKLLAALLANLKWDTNTCDSALSQLETATGLRRDAIMARRDAMVEHGFWRTQRRSVASGLPKMFGAPQRFQASNLGWPTPHLLPKAYQAYYYEQFAKLREARRQRAEDIRRTEGMTRQQRAERRQARRRTALAERPRPTKNGGSESAAAVLNPTRAKQALADFKAAAAQAACDEQATAEAVQAHLPDLMAEMRRRCGHHEGG
jgi:hypothetical protein